MAVVVEDGVMRDVFQLSTPVGEGKRLSSIEIQLDRSHYTRLKAYPISTFRRVLVNMWMI
jgi:hypothetical protein